MVEFITNFTGGVTYMCMHVYIVHVCYVAIVCMYNCTRMYACTCDMYVYYVAIVYSMLCIHR